MQELRKGIFGQFVSRQRNRRITNNDLRLWFSNIYIFSSIAFFLLKRYLLMWIPKIENK